MLQNINGIKIFIILFLKKVLVVYFKRYFISVAPESIKKTGTAQ